MIYLLLLAAAATAASEVFLDLPCFWKGILEPFLPHLSAWATSSQCVHAWRPTCVILSGTSGVLVAAASIGCMHVEVINYATPRARAGLPLTKDYQYGSFSIGDAYTCKTTTTSALHWTSHADSANAGYTDKQLHKKSMHSGTSFQNLKICRFPLIKSG